MPSLAALKTRWLAAPPADRYVVRVVLVLCAVGLAAVYSAVAFFADVRAGSSPEWFLMRHAVRVAVALGAMYVVSRIDYRLLARVSRYALLLAIGLLVVVKLAGVAAGGAVRWLRFGSIGFQPSDLARMALVVYVAVLLTQKQDYVKSFGRSFLPILLWTLGTTALIGLDDLSTAAVTLVATLLMGFVGRVHLGHLVGLLATGLALAALLVMASPQRAARVEAFLGIDLVETTDQAYVLDKRGEGYQAHQARIAFGRGGWTGVGPGKSVQRDFLPAPYNDFIFAIIAEEYGVVGALGLLAVFGLLLFRGYMRIARHAPDPLGLFLGVGLTTLIALYGFIHAAVACGLLPVTGLPMPFVSWGGTSMLANGLMVGILLNISRHRVPAPLGAAAADERRPAATGPAAP